MCETSRLTYLAGAVHISLPKTCFCKRPFLCFSCAVENPAGGKGAIRFRSVWGTAPGRRGTFSKYDDPYTVTVKDVTLGHH